MPEFPVYATPLNPAEVRVLGCLVEKEMTTPDYYPLTLNALTLACNQTSNRDPVVSFDEATVVRALNGLRERKLAFLFGGAQSRVPRYGHRISEDSGLGRAEIAALGVLMLRGPQTLGEIKGRTGRMHEFQSLEEVEGVLDRLADNVGRPLVSKLARQAGMKEQRYAQLLGGPPPESAPTSAEPPPEAATLAVRAENERISRLEQETAVLRAEVADLKHQLAEFRKQFE